jgi:hypothetical protein
MCRPPTPLAATDRRRVDLADIFRTHGPEYRQTHTLALAQRRAMRAIENCRTPAMGGHRQTCEVCGAIRVTYNSCRNRHCPKCQTLAKERWLEARRAELLPVEYFHLVFTLPHDLNRLAQGNPRLIYDLLFRAMADTLTSFGADPRHLAGRLGVTAVLHTWGQNLSQHIHLHCIVTGGALALDGSRWIPANSGFLFPVRALSKVFRGKFLDALRRAFNAGDIAFAGSTAALADPQAFGRWLGQLRDKAWVVYSKRPFAGPAQVLDYLGRYTHRVAISNERILGLERGTVHFRWKDYAQANTLRVMRLEVEEFIRRFLLHVVPDGFVRIRHFGILTNRHRKRTLDRCRRLLGQPTAVSPVAEESTRALMLRLTGVDIELCPRCRRGRLHVTDLLPPSRLRVHPNETWDTS